MRKRPAPVRQGVLSALVAASIGLSATAAVVFQDGFESSTVGQAPHGADPAVGAFSASGDGGNLVVVSGPTTGGPAGAHSGAKYLAVNRAAKGGHPSLACLFAGGSLNLASNTFHIEFYYWQPSEAQQYANAGSIALANADPNANWNPSSVLCYGCSYYNLSWQCFNGSIYIPSGLSFTPAAWNQVRLDWDGARLMGSVNGGAPAELTLWGSVSNRLNQLFFDTSDSGTLYYLDDISVTVSPLSQVAASETSTAAKDRAANAANVQPHANLPLQQMLAITWKKGPNLPQGFQDSDGGIVHDTLVTVCGFCSGQSGVPGKAATYPRGFLKKAWGLDLKHPAEGWQRLPDFPGADRQEVFAAVVGDQLYCWGGFSYTSPFCYPDGYRLSYRDGRWSWDAAPSLPWAACSAGIAAIGSKIYVMGGADYDLNRFYTQADRAGQIKRLGARLLALDTQDLAAGWKELPACPGTPRWVHAMAAVQGRLYAIGGGTGEDNPIHSYCTVVDNWRYDPAAGQWQRLPDTSIATGNFPAGAITFRERYILLVGGYQYANVLNPDGSSRRAYGTVTKHYSNHEYESDVLVFDTQTSAFGRADPLPLNNNLPMTVLAGSQLHLIGGETGGSVIEGEPFGHHPDLYLIGQIQTMNP